MPQRLLLWQIRMSLKITGQISQIQGSYTQYDQRSGLRINPIGNNSHRQNEQSTATQARNHQSGYFILLVRENIQHFRYQDGKYIGITNTQNQQYYIQLF